MPRKPYQKAKKPDWFDIKKYDSAKNLDASGWLYQLWCRYLITHPMCDDEEMRKESFKEIQEHGIVPPLPPLDSSDLSASLLMQLRYVTKHRVSTVNFLSRSEAYKFHAILELDEEEKRINDTFGHVRRSYQEQLDILRKMHLEEFKAFNNEPFDLFIKEQKSAPLHPYYPFIYGDLAHVTVNLFASNKQITTDFKKWLVEARKKLGSYKGRSSEKGLKEIKEGKFSQKKFHRWANNRLLAYIDLRLWEGFNGFRATADELAEIIYPNNINAGRTKIDGEVRPLALYLTSLDGLSKLSAYAKQQASETPPKHPRPKPKKT